MVDHRWIVNDATVPATFARIGRATSKTIVINGRRTDEIGTQGSLAMGSASGQLVQAWLHSH